MDKQEARKKLYSILHDDRLSWTPDSVEALQMAIDALGADNNVGRKDMVYRQDAIEAVKHAWAKGLEPSQYIEILPPAQPEPGEDCVSRKAVIRLLHSGYHNKSMIEEVKELPSVQPEPIRINLNEPIKVKLTDWGKEIYYHQYDRTNQIVGRKVCKPMFPKEDENGYTEFQLWCFIGLYGEHMGITLPNVIEPIEIVYEREQDETTERKKN